MGRVVARRTPRQGEVESLVERRCTDADVRVGTVGRMCLHELHRPIAPNRCRPAPHAFRLLPASKAPGCVKRAAPQRSAAQLCAVNAARPSAQHATRRRPQPSLRLAA